MICSLLLLLYIKKEEVKTIKARARGIEIYEINKADTNISSKYQYVAVLEIPKIKLKQGLVAPTNEYNNIQENIQILDNSMFPNVTNSNLILAAHNGNSEVSFFKNLNKLTVDDKILLYYNSIEYIYKVDRVYDVLKTGMIDILRDENKTTITLITCKDNNDEKQVVYIGYLVEKNIVETA